MTRYIFESEKGATRFAQIAMRLDRNADVWQDGARMIDPAPVQCDWCGDPFLPGEPQAKGYDNLPTHRKCLKDALKAWRKDHGIEEVDSRPERMTFTDWPNGQGTYD
jgi:hypothetical protein